MRDNSQPCFTVRVYGIIIRDNQLLASDETHHGREITKFPGGGLQFGEGTIECLAREIREELNIEIDAADHYYTVDFFQPSIFDEKVQVISIYYRIRLSGHPDIDNRNRELESDPGNLIRQKFRWIKLHELEEKHFTFPIDKKVAGLIKAELTV
jgi:8-oxo-dGTP diphosphatase